MDHLARRCSKKLHHSPSNKSRTNGPNGSGSRSSNGRSFHSRKDNPKKLPHLRQTEVEEDGETLSLRSVCLEDTDELRLSTSAVQEDIGHLVVYGLLHGEVLRFLLDTGADANFLSEAMANFLELEPTGRKHRFRRAFTDGASTLGRVTTELYLQRARPLSTTFHVVPLKDYDGIIGIHFMRQHQAVPMWEQHTCAWG
ncbi:hypothetical protein OC845_000980 [Tilletia horrida]|nr:hypothetical protein OC845_000980 [Tilletia horrida]